MKSNLRMAILAALAFPLGAHGIEHAVSGHVNRLVRFADDGKASEFQQLEQAA